MLRLFLAVALITFITVCHAKTIHVNDRKSLVAFVLVNDSAFPLHKQVLRTEAEKILNLKFTFSDKYKKHEKKLKPNLKLKKMVEIYDELKNYFDNYEDEKKFPQVMRLAESIFEEGFDDYRMVDDLLKIAYNKKQLNFLSFYYMFMSMDRKSSSVANLVMGKILNNYTKLFKKNIYNSGIKNVMWYVANNPNILRKVSTVKLKEIKIHLQESKSYNKPNAQIFDYLIARRKGVSSEKYLRDKLVNNLSNLSKANYYEKQSLGIILAFMVYKNKKLRDEICEKYPQILKFDQVRYPWITLYMIEN